MKVLANDGVSKSGIESLEASGFEVITTTVAQESIISFLTFVALLTKRTSII